METICHPAVDRNLVLVSIFSMIISSLIYLFLHSLNEHYMELRSQPETSAELTDLSCNLSNGNDVPFVIVRQLSNEMSLATKHYLRKMDQSSVVHWEDMYQRKIVRH